MSNETLAVELSCKSGHKSVHLIADVRSHKMTWCPRCGADLEEADLAKRDPVSGSKNSLRSVA